MPNCPGHPPHPEGLGAPQSGEAMPEDLLTVSADSQDRSLWGVESRLWKWGLLRSWTH